MIEEMIIDGHVYTVAEEVAINGHIFDVAKGVINAPIAVRVTNDDIGGRSLSLSIDDVIMLHIPVEPVQELLRWVSSEVEE